MSGLGLLASRLGVRPVAPPMLRFHIPAGPLFFTRVSLPVLRDDSKASRKSGGACRLLALATCAVSPKENMMQLFIEIVDNPEEFICCRCSRQELSELNISVQSQFFESDQTVCLNCARILAKRIFELILDE